MAEYRFGAGGNELYAIDRDAEGREVSSTFMGEISNFNIHIPVDGLPIGLPYIGNVPNLVVNADFGAPEGDRTAFWYKQIVDAIHPEPYKPRKVYPRIYNRSGASPWISEKL